MSVGDYLAGLAIFALMLGGVVAGAALIVRRRLGHLEGVPRLVAFAILATAGLLAVHIVPGMLGVLARGSVLAATAAWLGAAILASPARAAVEGRAAPTPRAPRALEATAAIGALAVLVFTVASAFNQLAVAPASVDLLNFHLPTVARWIQGGSIWHVSELLPNVAPGAYPNNGDVVLLAAALPWHDDFLAHLAPYPFYALTGVAVYGLARELGAAVAWALLAAALVLAVPAVAIPALVSGIVDPVMLGTFAAGLLFLARHERSGARADLVLAGLGLGISFGTKWYAVSAVAVVVAIWALARLAARGRAAIVGRDLAALVALVLVGGGIWLLRNWIALGDPFFPVRVAPLGVTIFAAPYDVVRAHAGSTILDYVGDWSVWGTYILPQLRRSLAAPGLAIALAAVVGLPLLARLPARGGDRRAVVAVALATALVLALVYAATPYTAGGAPGRPSLVGPDARYVGPALVLAAGAGAAALTTLGGRVATAAGLVSLVAVADGLRWSSGGTGLLANLRPRDWIIGIAVVGLAAAAAAAVRARGARMPPPPVLGVAAGALAVLAIAGGYVVQRHYNEHRYVGAEPAIDWIDARAPSGERIAIAGVWDDAGLSPVLPAFGPRYGNRVAYLGRDDRGFLRRYQGFRAFARALRRGGYDLLVVGLGRPTVPHVPERGWARRAGFREVARSDRLALFARPT